MTSQPGLPALLDEEQDDVGHEALRVGFRLALAELADQSASMEDVRLLVRALAELAATYEAAVAASVADRGDLHATDAAFTQLLAQVVLRLVALESARAVRTVALAPPVALGLLQVGARDLFLPWDRALPDTAYDVDLWPSAGLGPVKFTVKTKTTAGVLVTVTTTGLLAAGGSLGAMATRTT